MFNLFRKSKHFFDHWEKRVDLFTPFVPETGSLGKLSLGDEIENIAVLGKPLSFRSSERNHYTLEYKDLCFDCEEGCITYIGCTWGEVVVTTADGRRIEQGLTCDQLKNLLGAPDEESVEDVDDIILTYTRNGLVMECEFGRYQELVRINSFKS
ncbi:hypothetical protein P3T73_09685 [Kiritimatiellota bacterium B12222]|nr:hypothetical protein P3T73_09685 [Kiritimatiellota bacterium B12222]